MGREEGEKDMKYLLAIFLVGCATTYHPRTINGGYYDGYVYDGERKDRLVSVAFEGNGYTTFEEVQQMAWRRATEECRERHFTFFRVIEQKNIQDPSAFGHNVVLIKALCY
jgi:hypothetical protein